MKKVSADILEEMETDRGSPEAMERAAEIALSSKRFGRRVQTFVSGLTLKEQEILAKRFGNKS